MQANKGYELAGRSLFIALPAYDFKVSLKLAVSLAAFAQKAGSYGIEIQIGSICGCSVVSRARNLLAKDFLESSCTDLLFIDSDINFHADDVFRLLAWTADPKKGIVAGVPRTRSVDTVYNHPRPRRKRAANHEWHGLSTCNTRGYSVYDGAQGCI